MTLGANAAAEIGAGTLTIDGTLSTGNVAVDTTGLGSAKFALLAPQSASTNFTITNAQFASQPLVQGNTIGNSTSLTIADAATITDAAFTNASHVGFLELGDFTNSVTLGTKANADASSTGVLEIDDSGASVGHNLTLDASGLSSSAFLDAFGGAGNDVVKFSGTNFTNHDDIDGGGGANTIQITSAASNIVDTAFTNIFNMQKLVFGNFTNKVTLGANYDFMANSENDPLTIDGTAATGSNTLTVVMTTTNASRDAVTILGGAGNDLFQFTSSGLHREQDDQRWRR